MRIGVKARWMDANAMMRLNPAFIEVFVHEQDLLLNQEKMVRTFLDLHDDYGIGFVVHFQAYLTHDGDYDLVDLASKNNTIRKSSVKMVKRTLKFAEKINAEYVIVHPGGVSEKKGEHHHLLSALKKSLKEIEDKRILVENMPWFYIMRRGEIWRSNICIKAEDFFSISEHIGGAVLDISHAYLPTRSGSNNHIRNMKKSLGSMIKHVHVADSRPPHHEGLQIGKGEIDFKVLRDVKVGMIPEIIDGHKNGGRGFQIAITRILGILK